MAVVKMSALAHSISGKVEGSVFRRNTYGIVIQSNNWSKRGFGMPHYNSLFENSSLSSQWRGLTDSERASWYGQDGTYLGKMQTTQWRPMQGSTKTTGTS